MPEQLHIDQFMMQSTNHAIIDVRTPREFEQGHIPGAVNIPLFNNEERAIVGTLYKQQGRQPAILKGLDIVGPKMANIVLKAKLSAIDNTVFVHCWRGGMRSGSVAWLLEMYGFKVFVLKGGYKAFRNYVLKSFEKKLELLILGGRTGSGKTHVLHQLRHAGAQIVDLEALANHKGSAFGALGEKAQPTQEQFENELCDQISKVIQAKKIWIEDESRLVGRNCIPPALWEQMRHAPVVYIDIPFETRVNNLIADYGKFEAEQLKESILKITKRLGPEQTKLSLEALSKGDLKTVCEFCLKYYDKTYDHGLKNRENRNIDHINCDALNFESIAVQLIKKIEE